METVFEVPVRVTGIVSNPCGLPQIATAQAWIDGTIPEGSEVSDWLHEQGFLAIARNCQDRGSVPAGSAWYRPADNILMGDAMPRNFIKTPEGLIVPIDVSLTLISMALLPEKALIGGNCRGQVHGSPDPVTGTTYFIDE